MKTQRLVVSHDAVNKFKVIAKGVANGGFVSIRCTHYNEGLFDFGTKECLSDENAYAVLEKNKQHLLYLKEAEEIYVRVPYSTNEIGIYYVTYYNDEQFASEKEQASPINLTGTIQLNQQ